MPYELLKGLLSTRVARSLSAYRRRPRRPNATTPRSSTRGVAAFGLESLESRTLMSATPQVGVNLDAITYYSSAWAFTDAFKQSAPFTATAVDTTTGQSGKWGLGGDVNVDAQGWPKELKTWTDSATGHAMKQRLDTLMFRDIANQYPSGTYHR